MLGLVGLFVALSLYATFGSQPGRYIPDNLVEDVVDPGSYLSQQAHLGMTRADSADRGRTSRLWYRLPGGWGALGRPWVVERLTHALYLALAALGVILLLREFRPRIGLEHALAAFVYAFCPFSSVFLIPSPSFLSYALAPWFVWIALRGVRGDDPWRWAAAFALAVALPGAANGASMALALVPAALTVVYLLTVERLGLGRIWGWTWRAGLLSVLTCAATLVVLAHSGSELGPSLRTTETPEVVAGTSSWSESWRGLGFWLSYFLDSTGALLRSQATALLHPARRDRGYLPGAARRSHRAGARGLASTAPVRGDAAGLARFDGRHPRGRRPITVRPAAQRSPSTTRTWR